MGSCLGLGGICQYSAATAALDINKQVLYARDTSGAIVGRQLVAYSEEGEMACFEIYPYKPDNALQPLFAEYDRRFAAALDIPLFKPSEDVPDYGYTVVNILSRTWYDDGVWEDAERVPTCESATDRTPPVSSCRHPSA